MNGFTQFLIAQSLMSRPYFDGHDYEDIWIKAADLLPGYLKSDFLNQGTDFQVIESYLDTIPDHKLDNFKFQNLIPYNPQNK